MRDTLSNTLVALARSDPNVLLLTGDHGYALFDSFRRECPNQYINAGIAEQNMVGMAAGLARAGFKPFVYGLAAFIPLRVIEQIKLDVAHDKLPVIFIGDGAGFVYSTLGTSHQSMEDIAASRSIPNLTVFSPADQYEMAAVMESAVCLKEPAYFRVGKCDLPQIHNSPIKVGIGEVLVVKRSNSKIAYIATGSMVNLAKRISNEKIEARVISVPCIKPIDSVKFLRAIEGCEVLVTMEEHSVFGGLGSSVAEICSQEHPVFILRVGTEDCFSEKCGSYEFAQKEHSLDFESVIKKIKNFLGRSMVKCD